MYSIAAEKARTTSKDKRAEWEDKLCRRVLGYVRAADVGEETRRRHDRLGGRLFYGLHWDRPMPSDRAAITCNIGMAILRHKVAIMTKQDPIPVIEPDDVGDARSAQLMGKVIRHIWMTGRMREKIRRVVTLANVTRTAALKVRWDAVLKGGAGDIATEVVEGWNLLIDNQVGDPEQMEFCGHRATMNRSRAMLAYPKAAKAIADLVESQSMKKQGPNQRQGSPVPTPWKTSYLPPPSAAIVNGKPVVTAFAGELISVNEGMTDVDIVEMYHRDHGLIEKMVPVRDGFGRIKQQVVRDPETGVPQFDEGPPEMHTHSTGAVIPIPTFKLRMEDQQEPQLVRKYPHWRRTTVAMCSGEGIMLEDRPWDGPLPFAFYTDIEPLNGIIGRGSLLQTEQLQALVNVVLSTATDVYRFGALCAWLAGTTSGLTTTQMIPSIGQVIPVNDVAQLKPVDTPAIDPQTFQMLEFAITMMERVLGTTGIMQGEAAGRVDSASGYDTLAEIAGSTVTECTQRLETTMAKWAEIAGWFAQNFYNEKHAIAVEDNEGNITWERASSPLLAGSFSYTIATGSTSAWTESAKYERAFREFQAQVIDRQAFYEDTKKPNWRQIMDRIKAIAGPQAALGPAGGPPPRTRSSVKQPKVK